MSAKLRLRWNRLSTDAPHFFGLTRTLIARAECEQGEIPAQLWAGDAVVHVSGGLIHDWIGAASIPGTTIEKTLARVQDYDNHKNIYKPEVMDSRLLSHHGNDFTIFLRLLKKKIITVVMDTEHEVHYQRIGDDRWFLRSYTTRACEVDDAGTPKEKIHPPDTGYGFLWRLYSYWKFMAEDDGVIVECRAMSLSRDIPFGLGFVVEPIIKNLPRESLINTLKATRQALDRSLAQSPACASDRLRRPRGYAFHRAQP